MHSRAARIVASPVVATVVFVGSYYLLYLTDLFGDAMLNHWAHQLMNIHFLVSGYVFYWLVAGVDQRPRPLVHLARLGMLFAVMPFHALFGVIVMSSNTVIAETYYRYFSLPWVPDLLADQRLGGGIAWAAGEVPVVIVLVASPCCASGPPPTTARPDAPTAGSTAARTTGSPPTTPCSPNSPTGGTDRALTEHRERVWSRHDIRTGRRLRAGQLAVSGMTCAAWRRPDRAQAQPARRRARHGQLRGRHHRAHHDRDGPAPTARFHTDMAASELQDRIDADLAAGEELGVSSTPTIFVDGTKFEPTGDRFTDVDRQLRDMIDERLG